MGFFSPALPQLGKDFHVTITRKDAVEALFDLPLCKENMHAMTGTSAQAAFTTSPTEKDPYKYQVGFGNMFASEALPGTLPNAQNVPQKNKYDLYTEGITGSPFVAPRNENFQTWLYRIRPSVGHQGFRKLPDNPDLESNFLPLNPKVHMTPARVAWAPFEVPADDKQIDFVDGLKTIAGNGDPTLREGLALHVYLANTSMDKKAFVNNDGDMLIVLQQGRLDIQTEMGKIMARPGEIVVIQRGIKFKVGLPDGASRGYIQEIFGSHYTLPDLGPIGGHGLANPRDFESPIASFDVDQSPWKIVYKLGGKLFECSQEHTPFDVVAWHGNYVPYKYALEKFIHIGSISKDHINPSIFCVLTAKSKCPDVPLAEFLAITERWDVADNTFRPPYYHRNTATEFIGLIRGGFGAQPLPGGVTCDSPCTPHGVTYDDFKKATTAELKPMKVHEGTIFIMFETSMMLSFTDYAMQRSGKFYDQDPKMWKFEAGFMDHLDEIKELSTSGSGQ